MTTMLRAHLFSAHRRALRAMVTIGLAVSACSACTNTADGSMSESMSTMSAATSAASGTLTIQLQSGSVMGKQVGMVREFLGIPYAQPPVGPLRFAPPQPAKPWTGTRDATAFGASCPQPSGTLAVSGDVSEDCLTLNVYVPDAPTAPLPVMVFIHGGAFISGGSSQYDGAILSQVGPVIIVTLNYRLGALGFFSHPALDATRMGAPSGADGLRDQQLAMHWVHDNIAAFGGDPNSVTLFGESAGSASTCMHYVSPSSQGLAQRYIMESGACLTSLVGSGTKQDADQLGMQLADALCPGAADALACLRGKSTDELIMWGSDKGLFGAGWAPAVEGAGGVLPEAPAALLSKQAQPAPFIIGTNKHEWGLFQLLGSPKQNTVADLKTAIEQQFASHADLVEAQYPAASDAEANDVFVRLITDSAFRCPTRTLARKASDQGASVHLYSFEQGTAYHAQELDYVWGNATLSAFGGGPPSQALTGAVERYWTRFATTGDPNGGGDPSWPAYTTATDQNLTLIDPPVVATGLSKADCDFWDSYMSMASMAPMTP